MSKGFNDTFLVTGSGGKDEYAAHIIERFVQKLQVQLDKYDTDERLDGEFYILADFRVAKEGEFDATEVSHE